jgi:hypothetical protein
MLTKKHKCHAPPQQLLINIKSIYKDLAHSDLLKKCLHRSTHNLGKAKVIRKIAHRLMIKKRPEWENIGWRKWINQ